MSYAPAHLNGSPRFAGVSAHPLAPLAFRDWLRPKHPVPDSIRTLMAARPRLARLGAYA